MSKSASPLVVICQSVNTRAEAANAARALSVPLLINVEPEALVEPEFALVYSETGLALFHTGRKVPGPVRVDFLAGAVDHRRRFGGGKGQMVAKAVGLKAHVYPSVLDVTAGLGRDAFVLASLGCRVELRERSPVVFRLLADGLARARLGAAEQGDRELSDILARMRLEPGEGLARLQTLSDEERPDVIYLDPMFPERRKSADVKKEMRAFHTLVGSDADADALLEPALKAARYRVVVKRPRKAPHLAGRTPSHRVEGKSSRFDVYALHRMPERLNEGEPLEAMHSDHSPTDLTEPQDR